MSDDKITAYIDEVEQLYIKRALGDELYFKILKEGDTNELIDVLLNGGIYTRNCSGCGNRGAMASVNGLKRAIAYYVYAQNVMSGDFESTRFGMVVKNSDYSTHISSKERSDAYNNALEVGKAYLKECIDYCLDVGLMTRRAGSVASAGGMTIKKIG